MRISTPQGEDPAAKAAVHAGVAQIMAAKREKLADEYETWKERSEEVLTAPHPARRTGRPYPRLEFQRNYTGLC